MQLPVDPLSHDHKTFQALMRDSTRSSFKLPFSAFDCLFIDFVFVFKTHLFHELACQESHFSLLSPTLKWLGAVPFPPEKRPCSKIHSLQVSTAVKFLTTNKLLRSHPLCSVLPPFVCVLPCVVAPSLHRRHCNKNQQRRHHSCRETKRKVHL